ncbi:MAG: hypothetical protein CO039_00980 [Candidatus Pacebacteria bacterium CG_4_9_14_0_2_um_filter_34_50]|nr:MAG: hypothetical protein CO039_00980 [Candidatus Pacebacteria bacterium CG_4_9_14_0_2_um_filter_34_50]
MGNNGAGQSSGANNSSRQSSFGEKRSQDVSDSYNKALKERKKIARAQYAVNDDSLKETFKIKSNLLDRKISRMEDEMKDNGLR